MTAWAIDKSQRQFAERLAAAGITSKAHAMVVLARGERQLIEQWERQLAELETKKAQHEQA